MQKKRFDAAQTLSRPSGAPTTWSDDTIPRQAESRPRCLVPGTPCQDTSTNSTVLARQRRNVPCPESWRSYPRTSEQAQLFRVLHLEKKSSVYRHLEFVLYFLDARDAHKQYGKVQLHGTKSERLTMDQEPEHTLALTSVLQGA